MLFSLCGDVGENEQNLRHAGNCEIAFSSDRMWSLVVNFCWSVAKMARDREQERGNAGRQGSWMTGKRLPLSFFSHGQTESDLTN
jgi:hypothetical protein